MTVFPIYLSPKIVKLDDDVISEIRSKVASLYDARNRDVPFHGWHHVEFVAAKAPAFAVELGADRHLVEVAALLHDLNYLVDVRTEAKAGSQLRAEILRSVGCGDEIVDQVERIVREAETAYRNAEISAEAKALSDADTAFKALPVTPVVLAPLYMRETGRGLRELAEKIVAEQVPLKELQIYFYTASARERYLAWSEANLNLWKCILESLDDPDVAKLIRSIPSC